MTSYLTIKKKENSDLLKFDLNNCDVSLANAIRRTILSDVETIGFNTEPYENSDIKIIENTSSLHNEFLAHRLGMIPVFVDNVNSFNLSKYKFILNVENTGTQTIKVTTNDIKVIDVDSNSEVDSNNFFKPNPITNDYILIIKLKSNPNGKGEKINIEMRASKNSGSNNARYQPALVFYNNKIDKVKYDSGLEDFIEKNSDITDKRVVENKFIVTEAERCFVTDDNDRPSIFEFTVESIGVVPSHLILFRSLELLSIKLRQFMHNLSQAVESDNEKIKINESIGVMKGYNIHILNENHTLGYLIQSYIQKIHNDKVNFIGYKNPHPLKDLIELHINAEDNNIQKIKDIIISTCNHIVDIINNIKSEINKEFSMEVKKSKIIRKKKSIK